MTSQFDRDAVLHAYVPDGSVGAAEEPALRDALLNPGSQYLTTALKLALEPGSDRDALIEAVKRGRSTELHAFISEAVERLAVATAIWDMTSDDAQRNAYFQFRNGLELPASIYTPVEPSFSPEQLDRVLVTSTLMAECRTVSTKLVHHWQYYQPAIVVPDSVAGDSPRAALFRSLIARLDSAETRTRAGDRKAAFVEEHYALLQALRGAVGESSASAGLESRNLAHADWTRRRAEQVGRLSPEWRPLFEKLVDLTPDEAKLTEIADWPEFKAVMTLDAQRRGTILHELVALASEREARREGSSPVSRYFLLGQISVFARDDPSPRFHFNVWPALNRFASHLAAEPILLDDRRTADVLTMLMEWRDLCQFPVLDSAEAVLASGPAPLTRRALAEVARRPSHGLIPGPNPDSPHEGDPWWNGAPPRIAEIFARHPAPGGGLFNRMFGRKGS